MRRFTWLFMYAIILFLITGCGSTTTTTHSKQNSPFDELQRQRPRFEVVSKTKDRIYYLDNQSININTDKTIASFWLKVEFTEDGLKTAPTTYNGKLSHMFNLQETLIGNRKMRDLEMVFYSKDSTVLDSIKLSKPLEWDNIVPNSVGENIYNAVMTRLRESKTIK